MILDGTKTAQSIREELKKQILSLGGPKPGLAFILIGDHAPSHAYVKMKKKGCAEVGIHSETYELPEGVSDEELLQLIRRCNQNPQIHGILVQQPLPKHLSTTTIIAAIDPNKDVDGFHPLNLGKTLLGQPEGFLPCTPLGIVTLLEHSQIGTEGKNIVIMGRSNIVGKPLAAMLMQKSYNATVTVVHSHTHLIKEHCKRADILIAAIGQPQFVTEEFVKKGAVVIDVGINAVMHDHQRKLVGDVDFLHVAPLCSHITPVPGGVGPMTIAMLLQNTYLSYTKTLR